MANLKQAMEYASQNPNSDFANNLSQLLSSGSLNQEAKKYGINTTLFKPKEEPGIVQGITKSIIGGASNLGNTAIATGEAGVKTLFNKKSFKNNLSQSIQEAKNRTQAGSQMLTGEDAQIRDISTLEGSKQLAGDTLSAVSNVIPVGKALQGASLLSRVGKVAKAGAVVGGASGAGQSLQDGNDLATVALDTLKSGLTGGGIAGALPVIGKAVSGTVKLSGKASKSSIEGIKKAKNTFIEGVDAEDSVKSALNPFKMESTDALISVPQKDGSFILKTADKMLGSDKQAVQEKSSKLYTGMFEKAQRFAKDRRDTNSPLEIVGINSDKAMDKVNAIRQSFGKTMGDIEAKAKNVSVDLDAVPSLQKFAENVVKSANKKGFAGSSNITDETNLFLQDLNTIQKGGTDVETVLDFTRQWQNKLENLKDGFKAFTNNKRDNTLIQSMITDIKNKARNTLSEINPTYKNALSQYRLTSNLRDEGNRLLGKDGIAGERIKGAATAKRAVQSNSDGGARQFYNTLKQLTGYDGLQEADIAIQAMKDAGDYQGLSLLEVSKDILDKGNTGMDLSLFGLAKKGIDTIGKAARPLPQERTQNFIKKNQPFLSKKEATNPINMSMDQNTTKNAAISNISDSINQTIKNSKGGKAVKDLVNNLTPYAKAQLIKYLSTVEVE